MPPPIMAPEAPADLPPWRRVDMTKTTALIKNKILKKVTMLTLPCFYFIKDWRYYNIFILINKVFFKDYVSSLRSSRIISRKVAACSKSKSLAACFISFSKERMSSSFDFLAIFLSFE